MEGLQGLAEVQGGGSSLDVVWRGRRKGTRTRSTRPLGLHQRRLTVAAKVECYLLCTCVGHRLGGTVPNTS